MMLKLSSSLDTCIAHLAHFHGVELFPFIVMELPIEVLDEFGVDKVDEGISDIAIILCYNLITL
jgi:hypothetical protein